MKNTAALIFIISLVLFTTACGSNNSDLSNDNDLSNTQTEENPPTVNFSVEIDDIIEFGNISWLVLDIQGGTALIITEKIIEEREYHNTSQNISWENSDLRQYLNGSFYNDNFNAEEKSLIAEVTVINCDINNFTGKPVGNDTKDKIFLLDRDDVGKYRSGTYVAGKYFIDDSARIAYKQDGTASAWWLRSTVTNGDTDPSLSDIVERVGSGGGVGVAFNADTVLGVRPALWLNIE